MKKLLLVLALLLSLTLVSCASDDSKDPDKSNTNNDASQDDGSNAEEVAGEYLKKVMDSIGDDLAARAKAAGYDFQVGVKHFKFELPEDYTIPDDKQELASDQILISIQISSPMGSTTYGNNTVDCDLLRDLQYAVLESGVFDLSAEDIEEGKSILYSVEKTAWNNSLKNGDIYFNIVETPSGYNVLVQIHDVAYRRIIDSCHKNDWSITYLWDEIQNKSIN
ncbi:MAG: hypothetical protein E7672_05345 [Ruminococcaceae bacterium]|nr:hypothetical protein [Oscillospiraceae bacterium]